MARESRLESGPEGSADFPSCCKDAGEKMDGCGPLMEKMMAHCGPMMARFGPTAGGGASAASDQRGEKPEDPSAV